MRSIDTKVTLLNLNVEDFDAIMDEYRLLSSNNTAGSYFVSWGWLQTWLMELPKFCNIYKVAIFKSDTLVALFFLGSVTVTRSKLLKIHQLILNATGNVEYDNIWIEYNSILCSSNYSIDLENFLKDMPLDWDEFSLPGLDLSAFPANSLSSLSPTFRYIEDTVAISPYVDLEKVRQTGGDYLSLLSSNTRAQIRRSFKTLEKLGTVKLEVPVNLEHAFKIYREMVDLHQATWETRGEKGVFSSPLFCRFHERLICNRFDKDEIQLLRVHVGGNTIGCLYSFVWQRRVYFYQCGFNYSLGKKVRPGFVSHLMAVLYNSDQGNDIYDFLAGDARYKKSLATDHNNMAWGRIQRTNLKLNAEHTLRGIMGRMKKKRVSS